MRSSESKKIIQNQKGTRCKRCTNTRGDQSNVRQSNTNPACIEIACTEKSSQECRFSVDLGEEFQIYKKISSRGRALITVNDTRGHLGYLERALVLPLWRFKDGMK